MAAKKIKIDNASSKFKKQSKKREQKVIPMKLLLWELKMALRWHGVMKLVNQLLGKDKALNEELITKTESK